MDTACTIFCLVSQSVCLGLIVYVILGWRKRMQNASTRVTHSSKRANSSFISLQADRQVLLDAKQHK
jgi:hypothetical protein